MSYNNIQQNNNKNNSQENKNYKHTRYFHKHKHYKHYDNDNNDNSNKQENNSKNVPQNKHNKKRYFRFRKHHRQFNSNKINENSVKQNKTLAVLIVTLITMIAEISFGYISGSMALLADGIHMGTHAFALFLSFFAYVFISKIANKKNHEAVSKKISALAGYTSALILLFSAVWVFKESVIKFISPVSINFNEAIIVAITGLIVNIVCLFVLHDDKSSKKDFNFKAVYIHIITDALTSIFAIVALVCAKWFGLIILDPLMGLLAGILILKWSINLIKESSKELTDIMLLS
jgi:cation diffusion facilitator family transporter